MLSIWCPAVRSTWALETLQMHYAFATLVVAGCERVWGLGVLLSCLIKLMSINSVGDYICNPRSCEHHRMHAQLRHTHTVWVQYSLVGLDWGMCCECKGSFPSGGVCIKGTCTLRHCRNAGRRCRCNVSCAIVPADAVQDADAQPSDAAQRTCRRRTPLGMHKSLLMHTQDSGNLTFYM